MQDQEEEVPTVSEDEGSGRGRPARAAVVLAGLVAAVGGGWFVGPRLAPRASEAVAGMRAAEPAEGHEAEAGSGEKVQHMLDNLVLNPANSGGVRFLIASIALEVSPEAATVLEERDSEVRDRVLTVLAALTVEQLSDVALRDDIREGLKSEVNRMLGFSGVSRIFFPQFVIQ